MDAYYGSENDDDNYDTPAQPVVTEEIHESENFGNNNNKEIVSSFKCFETSLPSQPLRFFESSSSSSSSTPLLHSSNFEANFDLFTTLAKKTEEINSISFNPPSASIPPHPPPSISKPSTFSIVESSSSFEKKKEKKPRKKRLLKYEESKEENEEEEEEKVKQKERTTTTLHTKKPTKETTKDTTKEMIQNLITMHDSEEKPSSSVWSRFQIISLQIPNLQCELEQNYSNALLAAESEGTYIHSLSQRAEHIQTLKKSIQEKKQQVLENIEEATRCLIRANIQTTSVLLLESKPVPKKSWCCISFDTLGVCFCLIMFLIVYCKDIVPF